MSGYAELDALRPYNGPCGFCGGPDQRHRLADALVEAVGAGESPEWVAETYAMSEVTPEVVRRLVEVREANRKRRRYRWASVPTLAPFVAEWSRVAVRLARYVG